MNSVPGKRLRFVFVFPFLLLALALLPACSDNSSGGGTPPATPGAPTTIKTNDLRITGTGTIVVVRGGWEVSGNSIFFSNDGGSTWNPATGCDGGMISISKFGNLTAAGTVYNPTTNSHTPRICTSTNGETWTVLADYPAYPDFMFTAVWHEQFTLFAAGAMHKTSGECFHVFADVGGNYNYGNMMNAIAGCNGLPNPIQGIRNIAGAPFFVGGPNPGLVQGGMNGVFNTLVDTPEFRIFESHLDGSIDTYMAAGVDGALVSSTSFTGFAPVTTPATTTINDITSNYIDIAVAVGDAGLIMTSPDGTNWTLVNSGTVANLHATAWDSANSRFVIAGENSTIIFHTP